MRVSLRSALLMPLLALTLMVTGCGSPDSEEVVVYTSRADHLIKPLFDAWTEQTGVPVRFTTDQEGALISRLKAEGANSPADMLITVDAGNLWFAANEGVLQPVEDEALHGFVPANLRDPDDRWFGLTVRARTIVYAPERVEDGELTTYEALAEPQWEGRLCLRTSRKVYNQSLVATMIERLGEERAEEVVSGWVDNLATDVFANDNSVMEAVAAGQCDVGIVNTYYYGRLLRENPDLPIKLFWPNQETSGVHVNVSGAGITRHAPNRENAVALLRWLASPQAQEKLAALNLEYPVNPAVPAADAVAAWGEFRADELNVEVAGRRQVEAVKLMDRAGYK